MFKNLLLLTTISLSSLNAAQDSLFDADVVPRVQSFSARCINAVEHNQENVVVECFQKDVDPEDVKEALILAAELGHSHLIELILKNRNVTPEYIRSMGRIALRTEHTPVYKMLFVRYKTQPDLLATLLECAAQCDHIDMVDLCLAEQPSPSAIKNALNVASQYGCTLTVNRLTQLLEMDTVAIGKALEVAVDREHVAAATRLLSANPALGSIQKSAKKSAQKSYGKPSMSVILNRYINTHDNGSVSENSTTISAARFNGATPPTSSIKKPRIHLNDSPGSPDGAREYDHLWDRAGIVDERAEAIANGNGAYAHEDAFEVHRYAHEVGSRIMMYLEERFSKTPTMSQEAILTRINQLIERYYEKDADKIRLSKEVVRRGFQVDVADTTARYITLVLAFLDTINNEKVLSTAVAPHVEVGPHKDVSYKDVYEIWLDGFIRESIEAYQKQDGNSLIGENGIEQLSCEGGVSERITLGLRHVHPDIDKICAPVEAKQLDIKFINNLDFSKRERAEEVARALMARGINSEDPIERVLKKYRYYLLDGLHEKNDFAMGEQKVDREIEEHIKDALDFVGKRGGYENYIKPIIEEIENKQLRDQQDYEYQLAIEQVSERSKREPEECEQKENEQQETEQAENARLEAKRKTDAVVIKPDRRALAELNGRMFDKKFAKEESLAKTEEKENIVAEKKNKIKKGLF